MQNIVNDNLQDASVGRDFKKKGGSHRIAVALGKLDE
jgi:hypothetical protein